MRSLPGRLLALVASASSIQGLAACGGQEPEPRLTPAAGQISLVDENGVCFSQLSRSRCDHDERCGYVGEGKFFDTPRHCLSYYNSRGYQALGSCQGLIDRRELRNCLAAIESAGCDAPLADVGQLQACNYGLLCPSLAEVP